MPQLNEDDIYRASTQYRLWSFTTESLASLRSTTNDTAAEGVRAAIKNLQSEKAKSDSDLQDDGTAVAVDCLTVEEEQKLVGYYSLRTMQLADFSKFPTNVKVIDSSTGSRLHTPEQKLITLKYARLLQSNTSSVSTCQTLP